jgi:hypothetical protein
VSIDRIVSATTSRVAGRAAARIAERDMAGTDLLRARMRQGS